MIHVCIHACLHSCMAVHMPAYMQVICVRVICMRHACLSSFDGKHWHDFPLIHGLMDLRRPPGVSRHPCLCRRSVLVALWPHLVLGGQSQGFGLQAVNLGQLALVAGVAFVAECRKGRSLSTELQGRDQDYVHL